MVLFDQAREIFTANGERSAIIDVDTYTAERLLGDQDYAAALTLATTTLADPPRDPANAWQMHGAARGD